MVIVWFLCNSALYRIKLCNLCFVHRKGLKFGNNHNQCSDFMAIEYKVHIKRSNMMKLFRGFINYHIYPSNTLKPQLIFKTHSQIFNLLMYMHFNCGVMNNHTAKFYLNSNIRISN